MRVTVAQRNSGKDKMSYIWWTIFFPLYLMYLPIDISPAHSLFFSFFFQDPLSFWPRLSLRPFNGISWLSSVRTPWYFLLVNVDHGKLKSKADRSIKWKKIAREACAASRDLFAITKPRAALDTLIVHCAIVWFISLTSATHARPYRPCILHRHANLSWTNYFRYKCN